MDFCGREQGNDAIGAKDVIHSGEYVVRGRVEGELLIDNLEKSLDIGEMLGIQ